MKYKFINFNIPIQLKETFDLIIKEKRISRTSLLNLMIEDYCKSELNGCWFLNQKK
jgi:hypothetical protein